MRDSVARTPVSDFAVVAQVFGDASRPLTLPIKTAYRSFSDCFTWNEWLQLPIRICDLPRSARLAFTVWTTEGPWQPRPVAGGAVPLFLAYGYAAPGGHRTASAPA